MRKILVTGADGFIGSHLVELLIKKGYEVRAFVYYNSYNHWGWLDTFPENLIREIEIYAGDIRDVNRVRDAMRGVNSVFHLASLIGIPFSYDSPDSYVDTNIRGTLNVLQAARILNTERVLVTSTSEVYGTAQYVPVDECHPLQAQSPYSASKIASDKISESFYKSFDLPVTIIRPFNTYGPRQSARAVIPAIITQLFDGQQEVRLGDLTPTRDLVYVEDTVLGFLKLAKCIESIGKEVNIATQNEITIGTLAQKIIARINPSAVILPGKNRKRPPKSEITRLCGSNQLLQELTGWKPETPLEHGLDETIRWFDNREHLKGYKTRIYNI